MLIVPLQALAAAHGERITHGDIVSENLAMSANDMFYKGWHILTSYKYRYYEVDFTIRIVPYTPCCLVPTQYVMIDFGNSNYFPEGIIALELRRHGSNIPPEMTRTRQAFDYFKVDVWCSGKFIEHMFVSKQNLARFTALNDIYVYFNLASWLGKFLQENSANRPAAKELLDELCGILKSISDESLQQPIRFKKDWSHGETMRAMEAIFKGTETRKSYLHNSEMRSRVANSSTLQKGE